MFFNSLEQCMFWNRKFGHNMIITYNGQIKIKKDVFMYMGTLFSSNGRFFSKKYKI